MSIRRNLTAKYPRVRETPIDGARCHDFIDLVTVLVRSTSQLVRRWFLARKSRVPSGLTLYEVYGGKIDSSADVSFISLHTHLSELHDSTCSGPGQAAYYHFFTLLTWRLNSWPSICLAIEIGIFC